MQRTPSPADTLPYGREVYHRPSDMFVTFYSADSKSRATILHPLHGLITVPCGELSEV